MLVPAANLLVNTVTPVIFWLAAIEAARGPASGPLSSAVWPSSSWATRYQGASGAWHPDRQGVEGSWNHVTQGDDRCHRPAVHLSGFFRGFDAREP